MKLGWERGFSSIPGAGRVLYGKGGPPRGEAGNGRGARLNPHLAGALRGQETEKSGVGSPGGRMRSVGTERRDMAGRGTLGQAGARLRLGEDGVSGLA